MMADANQLLGELHDYLQVRDDDLAIKLIEN